MSQHREHDGFDVAAAATTKTGDDKPHDLSAVAPDAGPRSPLQLKGKGLFAALKRTVKQFSEDNITDWAAALTYYGVLSIFPAILVLVSLLGMLGSNGQQTVRDAIHQLAPSHQLQNLVDTVLGQVKDPGTAGLPRSSVSSPRSGQRRGTSPRSCAPATPSTTCPKDDRSGRSCRSASGSPRSSG